MVIKLIEKYRSLGIANILDHEKFNNISLVHHSTKIEGSTLTEVEAGVLINDGLTPHGKPLVHSQMVVDHYDALQYALKQAGNRSPVTVGLIKELNSMVLKRTGTVYNTVFGSIDSSKGEFRKGNVVAGATYFPNFDKVESLTDKVVNTTRDKMKDNLSIQDALDLSFDVHFNLVSIHPFYDGNGRTSRLLMNYVQAYYKLPLAIVHNESKVEYIQALIDTREKNDIAIFRKFMYKEYSEHLKNEIKKFEESIKPKKGRGYSLLF